VATGTPAPTYQWKKGGVNISGATNSTYTIASVVSGDAGSYTVSVTNSVSSVTSTAATLTVPLSAPVISSQPASLTVVVGAAATFTVVAAGNPTPTYQWKKAGTAITGATSSTYTITNVQITNAGSFTVTVTNSGGAVTSTAATLTVQVPAAPVFTLQPVGYSASVGNSVTYTAAASGVPAPTYQWLKNGVAIPGATASSYAIPSVAIGDAGSYVVIASNSSGAVYSITALLTLDALSSDFNSDGQPDILLENSNTGQRVLWLMTGPNSQYVAVGINLGFLDPVWHIVGSADFDGDGKPDILLENKVNGQRVLWLMGGPNNTYVILGLDLGLLDPTWHIVGIADFNRDGRPDILLENSVSGQRVLWIMGGPNNAYVTLGLSLGYVAPAWSFVGAADFNGDGVPDILMENSVTGQRLLWLMGGPNGQTMTASVDFGILAPVWHIAKVADANGDGKPDILLENTSTGQRILWLMTGPSSQFVTLGLDLGFLDPAWRIAK